MDTPIMPRRSIPTELKPRLRYAGVYDGYEVYFVPYGRWDKLSYAERKLISLAFKKARYSWCGVKYYVPIPS